MNSRFFSFPHCVGSLFGHPVLLLGAIVSPAFGQVLRVGDMSGSPGSSAVVPVRVAGLQLIAGFQFDLVFPAAQAVTLTPIFEAAGTDHLAEARDAGGGRQRVVVFSATNKALSGEARLTLPLSLTLSSPNGGPDCSVENLRFITTAGLTVSPLPSYGALTDWRRIYFTAAERANPAVIGDDKDVDGDGIPNLMEFASGGNPKVAEPAARQPKTTVQQEGAKQYFVLRYRQSDELLNATLRVEAATDLQTWFLQPPALPTGVTDATSIELETKVEISGEKQFLRLRVRRNPAQP